jgi:hypothetical protein
MNTKELKTAEINLTYNGIIEFTLWKLLNYKKQIKKCTK